MRLLSALVIGCGIALLVDSANANIFGASWESDAGEARACFSRVDGDPSLKGINGKLVRRDPTLNQLADQSIPNEYEVQLIDRRAQSERSCRELMLSAVQKHHPYLTSAYQIRFFQFDVVYLQLLQRRINFGNANRLLHEAYLNFSEREDRYLQAESDQQRRALADSMRDLSRQAQSSPPPSGTGRMTCRWIGPTLYCDPY
jgi:hypothetical protein